MLVKYDESGALQCPRCRDSVRYLHQQRVVIFERSEDADKVLRVVVDGDSVLRAFVPNYESGNPSPRRHGLLIYFWCESCSENQHSGDIALAIYQHKGQTLMEWED